MKSSLASRPPDTLNGICARPPVFRLRSSGETQLDPHVIRTRTYSPSALTWLRALFQKRVHDGAVVLPVDSEEMLWVIRSAKSGRKVIGQVQVRPDRIVAAGNVKVRP